MFFAGFDHFKKSIYYTCKAIGKKDFLWPAIYVFIVLIPPVTQVDYQYILMGEGGWSYNLYIINQFVYLCLVSFILIAFVATINNVPFWILILVASILCALGNVTLSCTIFVQWFPKYVFFGLFIFLNVVYLTAQNLLLIPLIGRVSKYLPEGFESTGVTTIIALFNLGGSFSGLLTEYMLTKYGVKAGYYRRIEMPQNIVNGIQVVLVLIAPVFLQFA